MRKLQQCIRRMIAVALMLAIVSFIPGMAHAEEPVDVSVPAAAGEEVPSGSNEQPEGGETEATTETSPEGSSQEQQLITDRPEQSEEIVVTIGTPTEKTKTFEMLQDSYELFVDDKGVYRLTYTIPADTDAETLTIDLAKALEALSAYAGFTGSATLEPGDSRLFEIWITSESGHTYIYKKGSFVLTTPAMETTKEAETEPASDAAPETTEDPETTPETTAAPETNAAPETEAETSAEETEPAVTGFDGQELDENYLGNDSMYVTIKLPAVKTAMVSWGCAPEADIDRNLVGSYEVNQFKKKLREYYGTEDTNAAVTALVLDYYFDGVLDKVGYKDTVELFSQSEAARSDVMSCTAGKQVGTIATPQSLRYDHFYNDLIFVVYGEDAVRDAAGENTGVTTDTKTIYTITDHDDGKVYPECYAANELGSYYVRTVGRYGLPEDTLIAFTETGFAFGFLIENPVEGELPYATASNSAQYGRTVTTTQAAYENDSWHTHTDENGVRDYISEATIGNYMKGTEGKPIDESVWERADQFFEQLLQDGLCATPEEAAEVSFMMAFNVDGELTGNGYQNTSWGWNNTIQLERIDGELRLVKTDENDAAITDSETTFQLWYYEDTTGDGRYTEEDEKYFYTLIPAVGEDGTTKSVPGFARYDAANQELSWTIDTTGGKLNIDYSLLEGMIYYLQEVAAPEGYELDKTIYILCDDEETAGQAEEMLADASVEKKDENAYTYAGAIDSEKPLEIRIVNQKTPEPEPETEPETDPETEPETDPETEPETTPETTPETQPETEPETVPTVEEEEIPEESVPQAEPTPEPEEIPDETVPQAAPSRQARPTMDRGYEEIIDDQVPQALPVTGQLHWPILMLTIAGMMMLGAAAIIRRRQEVEA